MKQLTRPVDIPLTTFWFPLPALVSITHRITGVILFAGIAFLLYVLQEALESREGFAHAQALLALPLGKAMLLGVLAVLIFHVAAGVRHLIMDFHIGDSARGGKLGAQLVVAASVALTALAGFWVW